MLEFINFFTGVMKKYVDLLFSLELTESVSVGSFILGCAVFTIVIGYLIGRFTLSYGEAESAGSKTRTAFKSRQEED